MDASSFVSYVLVVAAPQSRPLEFESLLSRVDDATKDALRVISTHRRQMLEALPISPTEAIAAIEMYLPHLYGLINAVLKLPEGASVGSFNIAWTSAFSARSSALFFSEQWHFEVVNTLSAYALALRARAAEMLYACSEQATFEERKQEITRCLCTAAGVFEYIKDVELARWGEKPPGTLLEKTAEYYALMSTVCLAEAQQLAIRFAALKGMDHAILAKLCIDVRDKYRYTEGILRQLSGYNTKLKDYVVLNAAIAELLAHRCIASKHLAAREFGKSVSYLRAALDRAAAVEVPRASNDDQGLRNCYLQLLQQVQQQYERELHTNVTCYYESMPDASTLELPFGHSISRVTPYTPPEPVTITITATEGWGCSIM